MAEIIQQQGQLIDPRRAAMADNSEGDEGKEEVSRDWELPDDFDSEQDFCRYAVQTYNDDVTADFLNTQAMLDDQRFVVGKQWDQETERRRLAAKKPVMTVNRLPAFVAQIMGNRLMNQTSIRVLPDNGGTKKVAEIRQGLIRSIEKNSRADDAYDMALQNSLIGGLGNFALEMDYACYDVFDQDIKVKRLPDPASVTWDHLSIDATGRDAQHVFVEERMSKRDFQKQWPDIPVSEFGSDTQYLAQLTATGWLTQDSVRLVSFWRMKKDERLIILNKETGKVNDVTGMPEEQAQELALVNPMNGEVYMRYAERPYAEMYLMTATNILAGPLKLPISRVPVFRVPGWEIFVGEERHRFGLIRFAKDPQRIHNYWRSVIVEKLMQTPKAKWTATKEAVEGYESKWRNSHLTDDPLLIWNGESGQEPKQVQAAQIEPALIQEANMATQDIKDVLNMHEASMGMASNEVSGKALDRRMRVSELGSVIYFSNLNNAIEEAGRVMNELIPTVYDTPRTIRVLGEDDKQMLQEIMQNPPEDSKAVDITVGKYSITVSTGPSYTTKRVEAVESMMALSNNMPNVMANAADLLVENMDWPGAEKIAARLAAANPLAQATKDDSDLTPEQQQQKAQAAQMQQIQQQMAMQQAQLQLAQLEADVLETQAKVAKLRAEAQKIAATTPGEVGNIEADTKLKGAKTVDALATARHREVQGEADEVRTNMEVARTIDDLNKPEKDNDDSDD